MPCKDGHMLLTLFQQWETLVEWVNSEGMAEDLKDEKYLEEEYRLRHVDHIIEVFKRWTINHSTHELLELGQLMRFPWAPVNSPNEVVNNPQLEARGFFIEVNHPEIGTSLHYPGAPYRFSSSMLDRWKRAPLIGEDNIQIYQRDLGLSGKELQELSSMGAI
jgi:crotonobetainyl-CoA:carnitine CoA-transferase CaiB-like acyl-CoA transferase